MIFNEVKEKMRTEINGLQKPMVKKHTSIILLTPESTSMEIKTLPWSFLRESPSFNGKPIAIEA
jgi:hypothetical protein